MNTKRSAGFIKIKHSILSCKNTGQLDSTLNMIQSLNNHKEFLLLLNYYNAKNDELRGNYCESEIENIHHQKLSPQ